MFTLHERKLKCRDRGVYEIQDMCEANDTISNTIFIYPMKSHILVEGERMLFNYILYPGKCFRFKVKNRNIKGRKNYPLQIINKGTRLDLLI